MKVERTPRSGGILTSCLARIHQTLNLSESSWLAVRGSGVPLKALDELPGVKQRAIAHSAPIRVEVGGRPITSQDSAAKPIEQLIDAIQLPISRR